MSYRIAFSDELKKSLFLLKRKDNALYHAVEKKILQIASSDNTAIYHFKNLRGNLRDFKRVHIGSFVLLFRVEDNMMYLFSSQIDKVHV
jgi:mRNA-degrading endonuclease RelE of RelBE toxin-antitoxin system